MLAQQQAYFVVVEDADGFSLQEPSFDSLAQIIRIRFAQHLKDVGLDQESATPQEANSKDVIRFNHAAQRANYRQRESGFLDRYGRYLLDRHFAKGSEVIPEQIEPILSLVSPDSEDSLVFRLATNLWSVPVSRGYGRRMRFLVRDKANGKVIGLFGLTDPVFNLRVRDDNIGWTVEDRKQRLVNVMDAHVAGAVPPYSQILGGKLVAALMTAQEVRDIFSSRYADSKGVISGEQKHAQLMLITVTSALGRSSLYNRLKLPGTVEFKEVGMTQGWGHFHVPDDLFLLMRQLLELKEHKYASGHRFGEGANWKMRVVREALQLVGLNTELMKHGILRQVYIAPLTPLWRECLKGEVQDAMSKRPAAEDIARLALSRWVIPRSIRRPEFADWTKEDTWQLISGKCWTDV